MAAPTPYHTVGSEKNVPKPSLKRVLLKAFGILSAGSLLGYFVVLIVIVALTNENISSTTTTELEVQIDDQAHATLKEAGDYLIQFLNSYEQSIVSTISKAATNALRSDYTLSVTQRNYFDYESLYLSPPLSMDSRQVAQVSFSHSCYYVTGSEPSDMGSFAADIIEKRNATTNLDDYFRHAYDTKQSMVGAYVGFSTSTSLYRHYPGIEVSTTRQYDPTQRGWYTTAVAEQEGQSVFTAPYADSFGKGWMISGSRVILDPDTSQTVIGVSAVDVLIESIQEVLEDITFLDSGKLSLFVTGGQVVSDVEWVPDTSVEDIFTYTDLRRPKVSDDTWEKIENVPMGSSKTLSSGEYNIYVSHRAEYDGQYYLVVFVKSEEIFKSTKGTLEKMEKSNTNLSISLAFGCIALFAVLMAVLLFVINGILRTFSETEKNVDMLLSNVGHTERNLASGMVDIQPSSTLELQSMQQSMNTMMQNLQRDRETNSRNINNSNFGNINAFAEMVPMHGVEPVNQSVIQAYAVDDDDASVSAVMASAVVVPTAPSAPI